MPTPHNSAAKGDFAKTVLMPGDPLRSKYIAENFLTEPRLVNNVRGVQGYTGLWKGAEVSVQASGMGIPSIGIYSWELYKEYGVELRPPVRRPRHLRPHGRLDAAQDRHGHRGKKRPVHKGRQCALGGQLL